MVTPAHCLSVENLLLVVVTEIDLHNYYTDSIMKQQHILGTKNIACTLLKTYSNNKIC